MEQVAVLRACGGVRAGCQIDPLRQVVVALHVGAALGGGGVGHAGHIGQRIHHGGQIARRQVVALGPGVRAGGRHVHRAAARWDLRVFVGGEINGPASGHPGAFRDSRGHLAHRRNSKAQGGNRRRGRGPGNAFQQSQVVQKVGIAVFQQALFARSVNVLERLIDLQGRRVQDAPVGTGSRQGHGLAGGLGHVFLIIGHHSVPHVLNGLIVNKRNVRGVFDCGKIRHL